MEKVLPDDDPSMMFYAITFYFGGYIILYITFYPYLFWKLD